MRNATPRTGFRFSDHSRPSRLSALAALALIFALWQTPAEAQVHPFYSAALESGAAAYERGDFTQAAESLRIASFGMLDEPPLLAETLTRLGLAQAAAGRRDEFLATFGRISRIEERFDGYSTSRLSAALKDQFEQQVLLLVPASALEQSTAFSQLYRKQELLRLEKMLPAARTAALEKIVAADPGDLSWQLMLAAARIENRSGADAIASLEVMAKQRPGSRRVHCLLGRAYLQSGRCEAVLLKPQDTVHRCDVRRLPTGEIVQFLECLSDAEHWLEAASIVVSLPPERRGGRPFSNWEKRIAKQIEPGLEVPPMPPYVAAEEPATPPDAAQPSPRAALSEPSQPADAAADISAATPPPPGRLPTAELTTLGEQLAIARSLKELQDVMTAADGLSREYPRVAAEALEIAGEAAYRTSKWQRAVDYLRASGGPRADRYDLLFYLAVSLYELGDLDGSRESLLRALPGLEKTPLVERYRRLVLGAGP